MFFYFHLDYLSQMAESSRIKSWRGSRILSSNLEVEKFDGTNNFGIWQGEVSDLLAMQDLDASIEEEMPEDMTEAQWRKLNWQACGIIRSCPGKDKKYPFMKVTIARELWDKLEVKYMLKSGK